MAIDVTPEVAAAAGRVGRYRWGICALLFAATAINYVDRQMIGVLKPTISAELGWSETTYADVIFWFQAAYAIGYLSFGRIVDLVGARIGYTIAFIIWTLGHTLCGFVGNAFQFSVARFILGVGESGNFPAGIKAVSEWFPARERAFATGVFNAGANVGAIITPLVVPIITVAYGWRMAFIVTGVVSLLWLVAWLALYRRPREHLRLGAAELALIESDPADPVTPISWGRLLRYRETWAFALGKFLIDPIWWLFLFWTPDFLAKTYNLDLLSFGPPLVAIYLISDLGSVAGGWSSSRLMKRGLSANAARKLTMLACAFLVMPIVFAQYTSNLWVAVGIVGLATAAHQAFSANLYTLPSDMFPRAAVGSVVGIGGTLGAIGGMMMAKFTGYILETTGSYAPIFAVAGSTYLIAIIVIHLLSPRLARVQA
ncbi:MFS transporter [Sphingomonas carotinifaciens]|uniref:MFS transporter n=1 Tax=Sphingomonas carotinifaciens TaxID=1166323 RepID=A0A1G7QGX8_9SPHN|nr:MFS transporter [Sphingomonas carotinifaciens]MBB4087721.1 ACS family hexuronate transporter-like MFS transporter [Sphingomonas carotinifaciens]MWC44914.1 MFS transporter [Sphingomonas carotinifaciens]SDF96870.1 MFS transporter, ACS family, hexuronate transporter [Sphingomonas carotinifaciens]